MLHIEECSIQAGIDCQVEVFLTMVDQHNARLRCLSIVYHGIELAEMGDGLSDNILYRFFVGTFSGNVHNVNIVLLLELCLGVDQALLVAARNAQVRAFFSKSAGDTKANTLAAASDDSHFSLEKSHSSPFRLRFI